MRILLMVCCVVVVGLGCRGSKREILIPESVIVDPEEKATRLEQTVPPYVVKMTDGKRTWQIEIPVSHASPNFQTSIPLDLGDLQAGSTLPPATEADRELIEAKRNAGETVPTTDGEARSASYLATLARVRELFKRRQYELALVELVELDRVYPDDERILEMKGTLYMKLGRPKEARAAWERVLSLNPDNRSVARALERVLEREE